MEIETATYRKKKNWRAAALPMAQGVLYLVKLDFVADALGSFRQAFEEFTKENLTPEQTAWALWCETFTRALADALRTCEITILQTDEELQTAIADFLAMAFEAGEGFGEAALIEPTNFKGYDGIREAFPTFVRRIDPELPADVEKDALRRKLDDSLRRALVQAWSGNLDRYGQLTARFEGPVAEGAKRQAAWMRHYGWIRDKFENAPVFAPDDLELKVKLQDVYVRLRCVRHEEIEEAKDATSGAPESVAIREKKKARIAHVGALHDEIEGWLGDPADLNDAIRVIAGGPGSGKSSFARAFACDTLRTNAWRVIFVELQHMQLAGNLRDDLAKYFQHRNSSGAGFYDDPLRWRAEDTKPHLLIFDGLDELARSDVRASDLTRRFIANLQWMLRQSGGAARPLKALVLGRSAAAEEGRKEAELGLKTLLHVLPFRPPTRRDLGLEGGFASISGGTSKAAEPGNDIRDPRGLLAGKAADQRLHYWKTWTYVNGEDGAPVPEGLTHKDLDALNAEPLLLHLLIVSGYMEPDKWRQAADNRNLVYEAIFEKVYRRDKAANKWSAAQIDCDDFFTLMECLGLATWAGGGRTGSDTDFERLRAAHAPGRREKKFKNISNADLAGVAIQFYTRQELDETGYEFIHKSFGEYLIARALLAAARRAANRLSDTNEETTAKEWLEIAGGAEITLEILRFVRDEVRRLSLDDAKELKSALEDLMNWTLRFGMPAHVVEGAVSFRVIEARQRFAEGTLLAVLNACARRIEEDDRYAAMLRLDWPDHTSLRRMVGRLRIEPFTDHSLSHISTVPESRHDLLFFGLVAVDLRAADLLGALLLGALLQGADLQGANLREAILRGAILRGANLQGANLREADLREANLREANLLGANLREADLHGANLREANLLGANLREADLHGANLHGANLHGANLLQARHLVQEQIDAAQGDAHTTLPQGLKRPAAWIQTFDER